jgi:hypothetical protein
MSESREPRPDRVFKAGEINERLAGKPIGRDQVGSPTSSLATVVMIVNVRTQSPLSESFQFPHRPPSVNGSPLYMLIKKACFTLPIFFHS